MVAQYPLVHGVVGAATTKGGNYNTVLYTGNGAANHLIRGVGFQPDLVWIKNRDQPDSHMIFDALRGATNHLSSDLAGVEQTTSNSLTSFDPNGFTVGQFHPVNANNEDFVSWNWLADETASHASHDGERYNLKTGLSIIKYTGTGAVKTINHSLGAVPKLIFVKCTSTTGGWFTYAEGVSASPETQYLRLDQNINAATLSSVWNDTAPTVTQFTLGTLSDANGAGREYVAYLFADVPEFSQFGHYIGNGIEVGPIVTTGFRPGWLLVKGVDTTSAWNWTLWDSDRNTSNPRTASLRPDVTDAEVSTEVVDFNSGNFQIKDNSVRINENGKRYVYACFAEAA